MVLFVNSIGGALYKHGVDIVVMITKWLCLLALRSASVLCTVILYVISSRGILYEHGAHIVVLFYTQYLCLLFHKAEPFILTFLLNTVIVVNREEEGGGAAVLSNILNPHPVFL